jgi:SAM-dependent methyltransferase
MLATNKYIGDELEVFAEAKNWKNYWGGKIKKYLKGNVLEVGAGIGTNTALLINDKKVTRWVCLEPDSELSSKINSTVGGGKEVEKLEVVSSYLSNYKSETKFDSVLYIDVIEHIENDKEEVARAVSYLKDDGFIIILVPAYNYLYNDFDKAIGHYRRYDRKMLKEVLPGNIKIVSLFSLDSLGLFASLTNKFFLKQSYPTRKQIKFWDSMIIPISKITDKLILEKAGKSIILVGQKVNKG